MWSFFFIETLAPIQPRHQQGQNHLGWRDHRNTASRSCPRWRMRTPSRSPAASLLASHMGGKTGDGALSSPELHMSALRPEESTTERHRPAIDRQGMKAPAGAVAPLRTPLIVSSVRSSSSCSRSNAGGPSPTRRRIQGSQNRAPRRSLFHHLDERGGREKPLPSSPDPTATRAY